MSTIHYTPAPHTPGLVVKNVCGVTSSQTTTDPETVTCKRCLAKLTSTPKDTIPADVVAAACTLSDKLHGVATPTPLDELLGDHEEYTGTPTGLDEGTEDEGTEDEGTEDEGTEDADVPTMGDIRTAQGKLNDRLASAKAAVKEGRRLVAGTKSPKTAKLPTIHLHDTARSDYGTWCKIPGQHSANPEEVTCKVCRAHLDGTKPLNAVDDRVKQARKSFRSFVARVAYMVFMDSGCSLSGSWSLKHTNMAGTEYEVSSFESGSWSLGCKVNGEVVCYPLGQDIKQWMEKNWSCGEER